MKARFCVEKKDVYREFLKKVKLSRDKTYVTREGEANIESGSVHLRQYTLSSLVKRKKIVIPFDRIKKVNLTEREVEVPKFFDLMAIGDSYKIDYVKLVELHFTDDYGVEQELLFAPYEGTVFTIYKSEEWVEKLRSVRIRLTSNE